MTSPTNGDALAIMIALADKPTQEKFALDIVCKHELGCTCQFCESIQSRFPMADASHPDRFEEQGGAHQSVPFDATNTISLQLVARSLVIIAENVGRTASMLESLRDVLRGRDSEDKLVKGPIRAIADHILGLNKHAPATPAPPQTQRTPPQVQQQLPMQAPTNQKRVATDQEMSGKCGDPKIRFDVKRNWADLGKPSFKGRKASECDPDFLDLYADGLDYFAGEAQKRINSGDPDPKLKDAVKYDSLDAARARGWAQRVRKSGYRSASFAPPYSGGNDTYD
jgi:hypothetical protein